jgi:predicted AlkP superfamily pyrophosphatase or phosphodiesterase
MPRSALLVSLIVIAGLIAISRPRANPHDAPSKLPVRLAVVIVFDQLRGDYVDRWQPLFGPGGFRRIQNEGTWFSNCYYPYASTSTGPGHSAILSGATLEKTGIINNEWYDRKAAAQVYCAGSDRYEFVPLPKVFPAPPTREPKPDETARKPKSVGNPDRMLAETVADVLKRERPGSKVFGLSLKDRSAILPTGKKPDGAFWFNGQFTTSTYYTDVPPRWVTEFNQSGYAEHWYGRSWDRYRPKLDYEAYSGPDDVKGENQTNGRTTTFPHKMTGGKEKLQKEYYDALANSPMGNELLLAFAKTCIRAERLGTDDVPDLLVVSFSSNDLVGHTFGPHSQEVLDVTLRSDDLVADLLVFLDRAVGADRYSVTITSDHGICPLPEVAARTIPEAVDATRVGSVKLVAGAENFLRQKYGKPIDADDKVEDLADEAKSSKGKAGLWIESILAPWVYLNARQIEAKGLDRATVAHELAGWLQRQPGVQNAYTAREITTAVNPSDQLQLVRRSYHPDRSGDIYIVLKPYHLIGDPLKSKGTNHGSPHLYDRHVPLMVYGPGLESGRSTESTTPQHTALITSHFLGIAPPKDTTFELPRTLLKRADPMKKP